MTTNTNQVSESIRRAVLKRAAYAVQNVTEERRAVCVIKARRVFELADQFPRSMFISTDDKAGFVVWSAIGTPMKCEAVDKFIAAIVAEAKALFLEDQAKLRAAAVPANDETVASEAVETVVAE